MRTEVSSSREKWFKKILVNVESGLQNLNVNQTKGIISVLAKLPVKREEKNKIWFISLTKIFEEKNLKMFYLPFQQIQTIVESNQYDKIPDP